VFSQIYFLTNLFSFSTTRLILLLLLSNLDNFSNSGITNEQLYASALAGVVTPGQLNSFPHPYSQSLCSTSFSLSFWKSMTLNLSFLEIRSGALAVAAPGSLIYQQQLTKSLNEVITEIKHEFLGSISDDIRAVRQILQNAQVGKRPARSGSEGSATGSAGGDTSIPGTKPPRNSLDQNESDDSL
jgi:hypothetical protein